MKKQVDGKLVDDLEYDARQPTPEGMAADKVVALEIEITALCNDKVNGHIDPIEKAHWMGVADAFARKHALWLADQLEIIPDPAAHPPLTTADSESWAYLAAIQVLCKACRDAARDIAIEIYQMTSEEINELPADWVATHILWP